MPKAKLYRGQRMTQSPKPGRSSIKETGRPRNSYKRYRFEETRLGFFLKYEVPVVYGILENLTPPGPFFEPPYLLVKKVCEASSDTSLKKPKFMRYLQEYKRTGLFCHKPIKITPVKEAYYKGIRDKKMHRFIQQNRSRIAHMRLNSSI